MSVFRTIIIHLQEELWCGFVVDFLAKDALLFTLDLQYCFIYSLHCSTCDSNDNILPKS